jgi:excisionase family DNA binding protein
MEVKPNVPLLFSPMEAAKILNVSRSQVYVLMKDGLLRSLKIGRSRRISANQIRLFLNQSEEV